VLAGLVVGVGIALVLALAGAGVPTLGRSQDTGLVGGGWVLTDTFTDGVVAGADAVGPFGGAGTLWAPHGNPAASPKTTTSSAYPKNPERSDGVCEPSA